MLWEPVSEKLINESIRRARDLSANDAKKEVERRRELYNGALEKHVRERLRKMFQIPAEQDEMCRLISTSVNVLRYVIDEIAYLYARPVTRRWMLSGPVIDKGGRRLLYDAAASDTYARLLERMEADETLAYVQRMMVLCHDCILRYAYTQFGHQLFPMTRDQCDVLQSQEDPRVALGIVWHVTRKQTGAFDGQANLERYFVYADAQVFRRYKQDGTLYDTVANPYAALNAKSAALAGNAIFYPFIDYHDSRRVDTFWREDYDVTLENAAIEVCCWLTYLNAQLKYGTIKQAWKSQETIGTGASAAAAVRGVEGGYTSVVNVGKGGQMGVLDFTVPLGDTMNVLREKLTLLGIVFGLGGEAFTVTHSPEAGVSIKLKREKTIERRERDGAVCTRKERHLARIVKYATQVGFTGIGAGFPSVDEADRLPAGADPDMLRVDYWDASGDQMSTEERELWDWKIRNGIATPADFLVATNPDIDLVEAQATIARNLQELREREGVLAQAKLFGNAGPQAPRVGDGSEDTEDDEEVDTGNE